MGLRDFFARRIKRHVDVYRIDDFTLEKPEVKKAVSRPDAINIKPSIEIKASRPFNFADIHENTKCSAVKFNFSEKSVNANNYRIKHYVKEDIKTHKYQLAKKIRTWSMLKQMQALPQERGNILKYVKKRPEVSKGEMILACYGPIVEGAVLKLALNKQHGTLLVWYKGGSRQLKAKNVYLIRRLGLGEKPEWRWL